MQNVGNDADENQNQKAQSKDLKKPTALKN